MKILINNFNLQEVWLQSLFNFVSIKKKDFFNLPNAAKSKNTKRARSPTGFWHKCCRLKWMMFLVCVTYLDKDYL